MMMLVRYVGGVEVGGWPVPAVYWYRVLEDGSEEEVSTRTHCTVLYCTVCRSAPGHTQRTGTGTPTSEGIIMMIICISIIILGILPRYVPSSMIEIRQIDQIRHCIIFNQVSR